MLGSTRANIDTEAQENPLRELARKHLAIHHQDDEAAVPEMVKDIRKSKDLTEKAIWAAARYTARLLVKSFRENIEKGVVRPQPAQLRVVPNVAPKNAASANQPSKKSQRVINDRILTATGRWYNWPLPGNRGPLGNATGKIIDETIEFYKGQENGMKHKRVACEKIRERLKDDKKVREVFSAAELARIFKGVE